MQSRYKPHPLSAPGDFYAVNGECISCGAPHAVGPDLIGWADESKSHCVWQKQPASAVELEQGIAVLEIQCVGCHRYAGTDPAILARVPPEFCDFPISRPKPFTFGEATLANTTLANRNAPILNGSDTIWHRLKRILSYWKANRR